MSGEDHSETTEQGQQGGQRQGGQPEGGQQPQGGQNAQPQGGQQVQGGQPQGGQAYGQAGQQPVNQGPGLAEKIQQPAVMEQLKSVVGEYVLIGVGFLLFLSGSGLLFPSTSGFSGLGSAFIGAGFVSVGLAIGPLVAVTQTRSMARNLAVEDNVLFAATFIANAGGYFVLALLTLIGSAIGFGGGVGNLILPIIGGAVMLGVTGIVTILFERNI